MTVIIENLFRLLTKVVKPVDPNVNIQLGGSFFPMGHLLAYGLDLVGPHCQSLGVQSSLDSSRLLSMLTMAYGGATTSAHGRERTGSWEDAFILSNILHYTGGCSPLTQKLYCPGLIPTGAVEKYLTLAKISP